jgi:hypothetical protein
MAGDMENEQCGRLIIGRIMEVWLSKIAISLQGYILSQHPAHSTANGPTPRYPYPETLTEMIGITRIS